jgi:hypothetical protein
VGKFRRNSSTTIDACVYRGPDDCCEIEVEVSGTVVPYWPGNYNNPPEGGYAEDITAIFMDGKKEREIPLSDEECEAFSEKLYENTEDEEPDCDE